MALQASQAAPDGVWWIGADGNVYSKGNLTNGVENLGSFAKGADLMTGGYNQIDDPVNPYGYKANDVLGTGTTNPSNFTTPSSYSSGGSGTSTSSSNAADNAYLDDQAGRLNSQKNYANSTLADGLTSLGDSYNKSVTDANDSRSRAMADYATKEEDTTRAKDTAYNKVDTNARTLANSLRQRLGLASGSDSSAYQFAAPGAVARQATQDRSGVATAYAQNFRDIGTAKDRASIDFDKLLADIATQKKTKESDFRSGMLDKMNNIDTSLSEVARQKALLAGGGYTGVKSAMAPYSSQIDSRNAEIAGLFQKYRTPFTMNAVNVQTPTLSDYMVNGASIGNGAKTTDATALDAYNTNLKKANDEYSY